MIISIPRGDNRSLGFTFKYRRSQLPIDLTGYTFRFTVRPTNTLKDITAQSNDTQALISKVVTNIPNPTQGKVTIDLSSVDTTLRPDDYSYDIQLDNSNNKPITITFDIFRITVDVTRTT